MARIRSIKPEFPHSESMGRVSRDARLLFIMLWTIADDAGRLRGNSRMLASLLFPYDDDARTLIDVWLAELQREKCIDIYKSGGDSYVGIRNWLIHQKIDKPSKSKIPPFCESSRIPANPRERSLEDQRNGSKDQGEDQDQDLLATAAAIASAIESMLVFMLCPVTAKPKTPAKGTRLPNDWTLPDDWLTDANEAGLTAGAAKNEAAKFRDYWCALPGAKAVKLDWRATWRNWCRAAAARSVRPQGKPSKHDLSQMNYSNGVTPDGKF